MFALHLAQAKKGIPLIPSFTLLPHMCVINTYLKQPEPDQIAAWASRGAGLFTDEILQAVRDPTSLSAQR